MPLLLIISTLLLLPFVTRPVFVDDHAHFAEALTLPQHWGNPYAPVPHMLGWSTRRGPEEANPPLYFYLMGAFTHWVGSQIWMAHLLILVITVAGTLAFYSLAKPFTRYPGWAALLWLTSPHVWLTANSLLIDALVAPFLLIGLAAWISGWRERRYYRLGAGACFLGLAPLVKYTGLIGIVLAAAWVICEAKDKKSFQWLWLGLSAGVFLAWLAWSRRLYGQSHFGAVAIAKMNWPSMPHVITLAEFSAATMPVLVVSAAVFLFKGPRVLRLASWCMAISLVFFGLVSGYKTPTAMQLGLWTAVFAVWLLSILPEENKLWRPDAFLLTWALGGLVEIAFAIRWVCARFLVVASPACVLLSVRALERRYADGLASIRTRAALLAAVILFSGSLAVCDWRQAYAEKAGAQQAEAWRVARAPGSTAFYPGATLGGLSFYLPEEHWTALGSGQPAPAGSLVLIPTRTLPQVFWPHLLHPKMVGELRQTFWLPFRTLDSVGGAGYYGSIWGPLPYSFSTGPLDVYLFVQTG